MRKQASPRKEESQSLGDVEQMLDYGEAESFLGIKRSTLASMVNRRQIPHVRYGARLVRFSREALAEWRAARFVEAK